MEIKLPEKPTVTALCAAVLAAALWLAKFCQDKCPHVVPALWFLIVALCFALIATLLPSLLPATTVSRRPDTEPLPTVSATPASQDSTEGRGMGHPRAFLAFVLVGIFAFSAPILICGSECGYHHIFLEVKGTPKLCELPKSIDRALSVFYAVCLLFTLAISGFMVFNSPKRLVSERQT
jgi:hypothetical protein